MALFSFKSALVRCKANYTQSRADSNGLSHELDEPAGLQVARFSLFFDSLSFPVYARANVGFFNPD
jgi:hypothetical protein